MDSEGIGAVYRYDAVGSFERVRTACAGKGEKLIQPFLDEIGNLDADDSLWEEFNSENDKASRTTFDPLFAANILQGASTVANAYPLEIDDGLDNIAKCKSKPYLDISEDDACKLVVRSFLAASEREISVGDGLEIWIQRYADTETNTDELPLLQAKESSDEDTSGSLKRTMIPSRVGLKKRGRVMLEKKYYSLPEH